MFNAFQYMWGLFKGQLHVNMLGRGVESIGKTHLFVNSYLTYYPNEIKCGNIYHAGV